MYAADREKYTAEKDPYAYDDNDLIDIKPKKAPPFYRRPQFAVAAVFLLVISILPFFFKFAKSKHAESARANLRKQENAEEADQAKEIGRAHV